MITYKIASRGVPEGFQAPRPTAINDAGQICGYAFFPEGWTVETAERPMVWLSGGPGQAIAVPGDQGIASDINEAGDVVGTLTSYPPGDTAFFHRNGSTTLLTGLPGPWSQARSINNNGLIAGVCGPSPSWFELGFRVFVYDSNHNALVETIEPLPGHASTHGGYVNDDGDVVGISANVNGQDRRLFIRRNGLTEELGPADRVAGINSSGVIVGTRSGRAFRYHSSGANPGFETFGSSGHGPGETYDIDINDAGIVIGPTSFVHYPSGHPDAGSQDLKAAAGWLEPYSVSAINNLGYITGWGILTSGAWAMWVAEPQPGKPDLTDHHLLQFLKLLGGVIVGGGGWGILPGRPRLPIPPHGLRELLPAQRDLIVGQIANQLAVLVSNEKLGTQMHKTARELMVAATKELANEPSSA